MRDKFLIKTIEERKIRNEKINNKYYIQIIIKYKNTREIIEIFKFIQEKYRKNSKVSLDFDLVA